MTTRTIALAALVIAAHGTAAAQGRPAVTFIDANVVQHNDSAPGPLRRHDLKMSARMSPASTAAMQDLATCLSEPGAIAFVNDWPVAEGLSDTNADAPPFTPLPGSLVVQPDAGDIVRATLTGDAPERFRNTVKFNLVGKPACDRLDIRFDQWNSKREGLLIQVGRGQEFLPSFKGKLQLGAGAHATTVDFTGSKLLSRADDAAARVTTFEVSGKIPIRKPDDVRDTPGAEKDASKQVADAFQLSVNSAGYRAGGRLDRLGARLRATGTLHGWEAVGYWAPLFGWFQQSRGFYGAELEGGWRRGDAEFTSLRTRKPDIGHAVARLGAVVEWAPRFCFAQGRCVNENLAKGLRFFVRARGWLDTFKEEGTDTRWRARPFIDSELFYNFSAESRLFLRVESGYLPPDLSTRMRRIYMGIGQAF